MNDREWWPSPSAPTATALAANVSVSVSSSSPVLRIGCDAWATSASGPNAFDGAMSDVALWLWRLRLAERPFLQGAMAALLVFDQRRLWALADANTAAAFQTLASASVDFLYSYPSSMSEVFLTSTCAHQSFMAFEHILYISLLTHMNEYIT